MKNIILLITLLTNLLSNDIFKPLPKDIKYNEEIINLGRELFYDPILSKNNNISCFSCHNNYGADNKQFSIGTNGDIGFINSPSIFNLHYKIKYFWNGRVDTLQEQLLDGPLFNSHEMANNKETIESRLINSQKYQKLFYETYGKTPNLMLLQNALSEFQKSLLSINSKFDKYLRGEVKLTNEEKNGLDLFISYGCVSCHNGINLGANSYQKFGSVIPKNSTHISKEWEDRYKITKNKADKMVFIVPSLRNIEKTAPYFHSGKIKSLKNAIKIMSYNNIGVILKDNEVDDIEAFLKTLTGEIPETFKRR